jgi:opacity protein-like surface antigen
MRAAQTLAMALLLALLAAPALAQDDDDEEDADVFAREGLYLSARGLYALEDWSDEERHGADNTDGVGATVGYRMSPFVGLEVDVEYTRDFIHPDSRDVSLIYASTRMKVYPMTGRIQPFLMGGIGILATLVRNRDGAKPRDDRADWAFRGGGGLDVYITKNWMITSEASYVATVGNVKNLNYAVFGLGVTYRFNSFDD